MGLLMPSRRIISVRWHKLESFTSGRKPVIFVVAHGWDTEDLRALEHVVLLAVAEDLYVDSESPVHEGVKGLLEELELRPELLEEQPLKAS